jgi:Spy/CpxP family protein refolding chaperone
MNPMFYQFWKRQMGGCGWQDSYSASEQAATPEPRDPRAEDQSGHANPWRTGFAGHSGVRRPLRFLAYKLALSENQVAQFARILDELKVDRAQAEVDERRSLIGIADALASDNLDTTKLSEATNQRVRSAEKVRDAVNRTLQQTHALLSPEQRERLAYLLRTGRIVI